MIHSLDLKKLYYPKKVIIINENIYDVTEFISIHPGGEGVVEDLIYKDATEDFTNMQHTEFAKQLLKKYLVCSVESKLLEIEQLVYNSNNQSSEIK